MSQEDRARWDARWSERAQPAPPEAFVSAQALAGPGRALDLAGGNGRHALWLAARGFETTLADVSPVALERALAAAAARGVELTVRELDTDAIDAGEAAFPAGPWDVIVCHHFLWRPLFAHAAATLSPDGVLLFAQPTQRNLERHPRPSARFLLPEGALRAWVEPHLQVLSLDEGWQANGRHEAQLVAGRGANQGKDPPA
ncbi:MAG: methyltransferase domain-containing protein [Planctomycetota bacterium]